MPDGKPGDQIEWAERLHRSGDELVAEIAAGGHVLPYFAEDVVREILSFARQSPPKPCVR